MSEKENTSGGAPWRKRAIASVGVAAAVFAGAAALASPANAVTPTPQRTNPTITVTPPKTLANDGTGSGLFTIEVNNSAAGNQAIPGTSAADNTVPNTASITVNFTLPAGVVCDQVVLTADGADSSPAGAAAQIPAFQAGLAADITPPTCSATVAPYAQPQNSDYTYAYQLSITSVGATAPTGNVTSSASIAITDAGTGNVNTITSNTGTTALATPAAAAFATGPVPGAIIYQTYSYQLVTSFGTPTTSDFRAFGAPTQKNTDGVYDPPVNVTGYVDEMNPKTGNDDASLPLENGFYFDTVTGEIFNAGNENTTNSAPDLKWTIIANNGEGGATTASAGVGGGGTAQPTPDTNLNDVDSPAFTLPVLFSDEATTAPLAGGVYGLSNDGNIKGFADGTFRPGQAVTRQEFVNILASYLQGEGNPSNGECSTIRPSAFSDVPNSSVFCEAIKELAGVHIINGTGHGKFSPSAIVSRQEIAAIVYRANAYAKTGNVLNGDAKLTPPSPFKDVSTSNIFAGDIQWAAKNHIVNGYTDGTFRPAKATSRDAAAAVIFRTDLQGLAVFGA